jgi:hypothetical protein
MKLSRGIVGVAGVYGLVILAIGFRLWFVSLAPQPFGWDQYEYEMYAHKIFSSPYFLASHSYRNYPYPLFLALVYTVVGFGNHQAIFFIQAVADSIVGLLLFFILSFGLRAQRAGWIALILYTFNPFTSGYVGVLLSEILSLFCIVMTVALGVAFLKKPAIFVGVLFGLSAGLAAEVRSAAFGWAAVPIVLLFFCVSVKRHLLAWIAILVGLGISVLYPLWVNWRDFHEVNISIVDSIVPREFFQGVLLERLPPFTYTYPVESHRMWQEFYSEYDPGRTTQQRAAMAQKYMDKAWTLVNKDRVDYIKVRFEKMWYVWQKENVFFYQEPGFASHKAYTYRANQFLLLLAAVGLFWWKNRRGAHWFVRWSIIGSIIYATLMLSLTHAEYRLTIPFYPLLFMAAAVGIDILCGKFLTIRPKKIHQQT